MTQFTLNAIADKTDSRVTYAIDGDSVTYSITKPINGAPATITVIVSRTMHNDTIAVINAVCASAAEQFATLRQELGDK
jgi:hypothetical protein